MYVADKEPTLTSGIQGNVSSRQGQTIVFSKDLDIIRLAGKQVAIFSLLRSAFIHSLCSSTSLLSGR